MDREMMMKDLEAWFFSYVKYDLSDYNQEAHARHIEEFQAIKELIGSIHRLKC